MACQKPFWMLEVHSGNISLMRRGNVVPCPVVITSKYSLFRPTITSNSSCHWPKSACQKTKFIMTIFQAKRMTRWLDEYTRKFTGKGSGTVAGRCERVELWEFSLWFQHLTTSKGKVEALPVQAPRTPEGWGSQISWQSAHEGGKVVSPKLRPPLPPRKYSQYSFLLEEESNPGI